MRKRFGTILFSLLVVAASALAFFPLIPSPSDHASVPWGVAVQVLYTGQVTHIFQSHHLEVTLQLKNGAVLTTKEPGIDAIFHEVTRCGEPCRNIQMATE